MSPGWSAEEIGIGLGVGAALTWAAVLLLRVAKARGWASEAWAEVPAVALAGACFAVGAGGRRQRLHCLLHRRGAAGPC